MQPAVYRVTHQRLALSGIRLGLAVLGFVGSIAAGADEAAAGIGLALSGIRLGLAALGFVGSIVAGADAAAAGIGLALGAGICGLALVTDRRWLLLGKPTAGPLPEGAGRVPLTRAVASALLPSTVGVAVLAAASLAFQPILAAVLAGILAGMGIVGLVSWLEVVLWERQEDAHLFADADVHTRRYVAPASSAHTAAGPSVT